MTPDHNNPAFGIYVHWPWCVSKCPYCDFNSHVDRRADQALMADNLCTELRHYAARTQGQSGSRTVHSIFFGGGTPSLMNVEVMEKILAEIRVLWPFANDIEISMEANPSSADASRFAGYRAAGVERLSLGVQALNDRDLTALGRLHDVAEARTAIDLAREHFPRISFDLIYARPEQTLKAWRAELSKALQLAPDHLSLYQLTFEPGTPFYTLMQAGKITPLDDDTGADLYEITQSLCQEAGLRAYEISNHARAGAACRHNLIYWRMHDYIGVGPGAHGRFREGAARRATVALSDPHAWSAQVQAKGHGLATDEPVALLDQATEMMLMGLRLDEGVSLSRYEALAGTPLARAPLERLQSQGLISKKGENLRATDAGRPVLNAVLAALLA
jgi:oxygen-independent coproporphyrinogen-3 oxidase